jgi:hypothetical protein
VFPVLRLPALRPPGSQCAPGLRPAKGSDPVTDLLFFCSSFRDVISGNIVDHGRLMREYPKRATVEW